MENDPAQLRRKLKEAEGRVERMRALRDAATGRDRDDLDKRLRYCEYLLEEVRENVAEVEYQSFRIALQRTLDQL